LLYFEFVITDSSTTHHITKYEAIYFYEEVFHLLGCLRSKGW